MKLNHLLAALLAALALTACDQSEQKASTESASSAPQTAEQAAPAKEQAPQTNNASSSTNQAEASSAQASAAEPAKQTPAESASPVAGEKDAKQSATAQNPTAVPQNFHYQDVVEGNDFKSYKFNAEKGQKVLVNLSTQGNAGAFLYGYDDFMTGEPYTLPETGEYEVRVVLPRNSVRKGEKATFEIDISVK